MVVKIKGIQRFMVLPGHPSYNSSVGILFDDPDGSIKKAIEEAVNSMTPIFF